MRISVIVAWYDLWVGAYWDAPRKRLYVLPIPCVGLVFDLSPLEVRPSVGDPGVRDPDFVCTEYSPGKPEYGRCEGDGHYLCRECKHFEEK